MMKRACSALLSFLILFTLIFSNVRITSYAYDDPMIVVSLGDSYASGEGLGNFYGHDKPLSEKVYDKDWIAHRSKDSWGAQISVPGSGITGSARKTGSSSDLFQWYFAAASGAKSNHVYLDAQDIDIKKSEGALWWEKTYEYTAYLPVQTDIFNNIEYGTVDYVTLSIGGNDVEFEKIMIDAGEKVEFLGDSSLATRLERLTNNLPNTMRDLRSCYQAIRNAAGPQAEIIVTGYPKLLYPGGRSVLFEPSECRMINEKVHLFNMLIEKNVKHMDDKFHYVNIEKEFDKDDGHGAYSGQPWINELIFRVMTDDVDESKAISAYSFHPNAIGAAAYARCVNEVIKEIEEKRYGTLSGKVCMASDRSTPVTSATISATGENRGNIGFQTTDNEGGYVISLAEDSYIININAPGYIPFTAYANVIENKNTFVETYLLVAGQEGESGMARGKIINAETGAGVSDAYIEIRNGWSNSSRGNVVTTTRSNSDGYYTVDLPLGNYTLIASKNGYISDTANIIVQKGMTENQDCSITPAVTGGEYRIVLSWQANPRDLDSHVVGRYANGSEFHVYYTDKNAYDNSERICNLDVDDTDGYGPETITLSAGQSTPYYYYIHRYAGNGYISTSEAVIKVYKAGVDEPIAKFNVPTNIGNGDYWNVFAIVDGQIVTRNTMTDYPDTAYAGGPNRMLARMAVSPFTMDLSLDAKEPKEGNDLKEKPEEAEIVDEAPVELSETSEELTEELTEELAEEELTEETADDTEETDPNGSETEKESNDETDVTAPTALLPTEEESEEATTEEHSEQLDQTESETTDENAASAESIAE